MPTRFVIIFLPSNKVIHHLLQYKDESTILVFVEINCRKSLGNSKRISNLVKIKMSGFILNGTVLFDSQVVLREMRDHIYDLKECVEYGLKNDETQCHNCKEWHSRWSGHDTGSGYGYNCEKSKGAEFYLYTGDLKMNGHKLCVLPETSVGREALGKEWLEHWEDFKAWLNYHIEEQVVNTNIDVTKLNVKEQEQLKRLLKKAKR